MAEIKYECIILLQINSAHKWSNKLYAYNLVMMNISFQHLDETSHYCPVAPAPWTKIAIVPLAYQYGNFCVFHLHSHCDCSNVCSRKPVYRAHGTLWWAWFFSRPNLHTVSTVCHSEIWGARKMALCIDGTMATVWHLRVWRGDHRVPVVPSIHRNWQGFYYSRSSHCLCPRSVYIIEGIPELRFLHCKCYLGISYASHITQSTLLILMAGWKRHHFASAMIYFSKLYIPMQVSHKW